MNFIDINSIPKYGIIYIRSEDTFSRMVRSYTHDNYSFIGFFYSSGITSKNLHYIFVLNTHNNEHPSWIRHDFTIQKLISFPVVSEIKINPIDALNDPKLEERFKLSLTNLVRKDNDTGYMVINRILDNLKISNLHFEKSKEYYIEIPDYTSATKENNRNDIDSLNVRNILSFIHWKNLIEEEILLRLFACVDILLELSLEMSKSNDPTNKNNYSEKIYRLSIMIDNYKRELISYSLSLEYNLDYIQENHTNNEIRELISYLDSIDDPRLTDLQNALMKKLVK